MDISFLFLLTFIIMKMYMSLLLSQYNVGEAGAQLVINKLHS